MTDDKPKPLPCRVCARVDLVVYDSSLRDIGGGRVTCKRCDVAGPSGDSPTAVVLWNERCATDTPPLMAYSPQTGAVSIDTLLVPRKTPGDAAAMTPEEALEAGTLACHGVLVELHAPMFCPDPNDDGVFGVVTLGLGVPKDTPCRLIGGLNHSTMLVARDDHIVLVPVIQRNAV